MNGHIILVFLVFIFIALWNKKWALFAGFFLLLWMFSFRSNEIPDTAIYRWMYDDPISRLDINEIGFLYLGILFQDITGADYEAFNVFVVCLCIILWYNASLLILPEKENRGMLFLIFLSFYGFFYLGITIRNCLSELLILCGFGCYMRMNGTKRIYLYYAFILLAMLTHRSAALFIFILPAILLKIPKHWYYRIFFICIIMWLVSGASWSRGIVGQFSKLSMFEKLDNYSSSTESAPSLLSLQILMNWIVSYFAIKFRHNIDMNYKVLYERFLKTNILGLLTMSLIWSIPTSYRFYNMFFFFNFILIYLMVYHNRLITDKSRKQALSFAISIVYFAILLHSFPEILFY